MLIKISPLQQLEPIRGYVALSMFEEALDELSILPEEVTSSKHALVLLFDIRLALILLFDIRLALKDWTAARELAQGMTVKSPECPHWWCRWAWALRFETSVAASRAVLAEGVLLHPGNAGIQYNLACYA
ncbi:MAG: hypothetical protein EOP84_13530, partial [Verrucomicrobiaceae bacterium]